MWTEQMSAAVSLLQSTTTQLFFIFCWCLFIMAMCWKLHLHDCKVSCQSYFSTMNTKSYSEKVKQVSFSTHPVKIQNNAQPISAFRTLNKDSHGEPHISQCSFLWRRPHASDRLKVRIHKKNKSGDRKKRQKKKSISNFTTSLLCNTQ